MEVIADELDGESIVKLVALSASMKKFSYSPYSKFPVGTALLCEDGTVYTGCNVENGSFQLCICAEMTAIVKAVSEGHTKFRAIFVASDLKEQFIVPCGACRQYLSEFGTDWYVYMTKPDGTYLRRTVEQLLPGTATPSTVLARMRENCCSSTPANQVKVKSGSTQNGPHDDVIES